MYGALHGGPAGTALQLKKNSSMDSLGGPDNSPPWTRSRKDLREIAIGPSRLWFALGYDIVNELYSARMG